MLDGFKKFALRGNVVDLAIGVIIGAAFGAIVIFPRRRRHHAGDWGDHPGRVQISAMRPIPLSCKITANSLVEAKKQGAVLAWGNFVTVTLNFVIIASGVCTFGSCG